MHGYTSKQLFKVNGGEKLYIYKDGFGDVYSATPEEEREWTAELIAESLQVLEVSDNSTQLENAIDTLLYHMHPGMDVWLLNRMLLANTKKKLVFATALWRFFRIADSFSMVCHAFDTDREVNAGAVFRALQKFEEHPLARPFLEAVVNGDDKNLSAKAAATIDSWRYADQPALTYRKRTNQQQ